MLGESGAAYGFRWRGIAGDELCLGGAEEWPVVSVTQTITGDPGLPGADVGPDRASVQTPAARLSLDRKQSRMEICARETVPEADVIHPSLWPAAAVFARWHGRETFHAGAVSFDGEGAWAIVGDRGAGKSSLLCALALRGVQVLVDDLLVVDGPRCFAGPRCIDLRPDAATALALDDDTAVVRCTERRRLKLSPCPGTYHLRGFVYLGWGSDTRVDRLTAAESFAALIDHRRVAVLGADFHHLLELAGLPALGFTRPVGWRALDGTIPELTGSLSELGRMSLTQHSAV